MRTNSWSWSFLNIKTYSTYLQSFYYVLCCFQPCVWDVILSKRTILGDLIPRKIEILSLHYGDRTINYYWKSDWHLHLILVCLVFRRCIMRLLCSWLRSMSNHVRLIKSIRFSIPSHSLSLLSCFSVYIPCCDSDFIVSSYLNQRITHESFCESLRRYGPQQTTTPHFGSILTHTRVQSRGIVQCFPLSGSQ